MSITIVLPLVHILHILSERVQTVLPVHSPSQAVLSSDCSSCREKQRFKRLKWHRHIKVWQVFPTFSSSSDPQNVETLTNFPFSCTTSHHKILEAETVKASYHSSGMCRMKNTILSIGLHRCTGDVCWMNKAYKVHWRLCHRVPTLHLHIHKLHTNI